MHKEIRINYKSVTDEHNVKVIYYLKIWPQDKEIWWGFHPILPKGMNWKAGDQFGLGSDHHESTQTFEEFLIKPKKALPPEEYESALQIIEKHS